MSGELAHLNPERRGEKTRREMVTYIADYAKAKGYPPTVREIGEAFGLASPASVHRHLVLLVREGRIERDESKPRTIRVLIGDDDDAA